MANENVQAILDRILRELKSENKKRELAAIQELETIKFSSEAIVIQLEKLVLQKTGDVHEIALRALGLQTSQFVSSKRSALNRSSRVIILQEIETWQKNGLLEPDRADLIKRRYDFDMYPGIASRPATPQPEGKSEELVEKKVSAQADAPKPATAPPLKSTSHQTRSAEPRPSLTQILLSENSIRIYLYLGAFFVISSAAILAAIIEAARLPILFIATLIFAGGAIGLKNRLPQPSFALAVVFSFLLPIDANVLSDSLNLSLRGSDFYWAGIFFSMMAVWGIGTWFYESRMFSLAAFLALILGVLRFDNAINLSTHWTVFTIGFATLVSLASVLILQNWKDKKFAQPIFITAQVLQIIVLFMSLSYIAFTLFESNVSPNVWIAHTLTWLFAATFFAASNILVPFNLFPWMAVASLFLIPWMFLSAFDAPVPVHITGIVVWGALAAFASELTSRIQNKSLQQYSPALLSVSFPLFVFAFFGGAIEDTLHAFAVLLSVGVVYTLVNILRARWYVWSVALLSLLGAFFLFFTLPFMKNLDVYFGYQLLIASIILTLPELSMTKPLTFKRSWNWPPVLFGTLLVALNILLAHVVLLDSDTHFGRSAITLGIYALLFAAYATHFRQPLLGYLSTTSLALTVVYSLVHYDLDFWLPSLTALSVTYYFAGYLLSRNEQIKPWGAMLVNSGLALGMIFSTVALLTLKSTGGLYAIIIGTLFLVEMFTRRNSYLEQLALAMFSVTTIIILNDFNVQTFTYYPFALSLLWLGGDAVLHLVFKDRKLDFISKALGGLAALIFVLDVAGNNTLASSAASACFAVYTLFFAAYAFVFKRAKLGYLSTASAAVTMFYALDHFKIEAWLPIFAGMTLIYYLVGYFIREETTDWSEMFRYSGLALGSIVSLVALLGQDPTGGWYALVIGVLFIVETVSSRNGWFEAGIHVSFGIAAFLILHDFKIYDLSYILLALSLVWMGGDVVLHKTFKERKIATPVRLTGAGIAALNALVLLVSSSTEAAIGFGIYAVFFTIYALLYNQPLIGYVSTVSLPLAVLNGFHAAGINAWLFPGIAIAVLYYGIGYFLRRTEKAKWDEVLLFSGLGLGTLTALLAPFQSGDVEKAIPIAIAATLFAVEAFYLRNVWFAFPANGLYLISYFTLLIELNVDQPQYFSIGAALLGMLMHYLLTRAESKTGALIMGTVSQLVLLGTSYVQLISTSQVGYFFVLFFQSLVIIFYGLYMRSRSLVFAPISIVVLATLTILYSALQNLSLVIIIGVSGLVLLTLGILAVLMRERITSFVERFNDWNA